MTLNFLWGLGRIWAKSAVYRGVLALVAVIGWELLMPSPSPADPADPADLCLAGLYFAYSAVIIVGRNGWFVLILLAL